MNVSPKFVASDPKLPQPASLFLYRHDSSSNPMSLEHHRILGSNAPQTSWIVILAVYHVIKFTWFYVPRNLWKFQDLPSHVPNKRVRKVWMCLIMMSSNKRNEILIFHANEMKNPKKHINRIQKSRKCI